MGGDGQKQELNQRERLTSAQLEDDISRAEDGIRTRDPHLGKVMRYHGATSAWDKDVTAATGPPVEE